MRNLLLLFTALLMMTNASASEPEVVYKFYCAQCHGINGDGKGPNITPDFPTDPRNFTKAEEMVKLKDSDIRNVILDGGPAVSKSALMPPWSKTLTSEEVDGLVKILRGFCKCQGAS